MIGAQLHFVDSYQLTQSASRFWIERLEDPEVVDQRGLLNYYQNNRLDSPYSQANYPQSQPRGQALLPQKIVRPPSWICWPVIFSGAFMLLQGISMNRD
jgi:hypothetical protein